VWLYNSAGLEYATAGDPQQALDWFTPGLQLALDTGDPENLVAQLRALRREQLDDLSHELNELDARAETFPAERRSRPQAAHWPDYLPRSTPSTRAKAQRWPRPLPCHPPTDHRPVPGLGSRWRSAGFRPISSTRPCAPGLTCPMTGTAPTTATTPTASNATYTK